MRTTSEGALSVYISMLCMVDVNGLGFFTFMLRSVLR